MLKRITKYLFFAVLFLTACSKNSSHTAQDSEILVSTDDKGFSEILGRPTNTSVTMSILFDQSSDVYWEYGTSTGVYPLKTATFTAIKDKPLETDFTNLSANTKYFYRTCYRASGVTSSFLAGSEHSFQTQRPAGSAFTFTIESDEHMYDKKGVVSIYQITLNNQSLDNPDFMLTLGDTFGDDHQATSITSAQLDALHKYYRAFFGKVSHSVPLFVCLGNHEGENDYYMGLTPPNNLAINGTLWRKYYYPNPFPNAFYSGNTENEPWGISQPQNYYAWTWGDALFVVLDVYRYQNKTNPKPEGWDWSLGQTQYNWLKTTLEASKSKYKFVFAHHVRGEGRGALNLAKYFEWGGYESNGTTFSFASKRLGWAKPIHQLFVDNKVNIFFQGHDHLFAHEVLDGVAYQEVPMPSDSTYQIGKLANADAYVSDVVDGTGHLRVNVSPAGIKVDYVQAYLPRDENGSRKNRQVAFTYSIK
ncbi:MAG: metallophosphoesterase [Prolixibacteraceae bacterium]